MENSSRVVEASSIEEESYLKFGMKPSNDDFSLSNLKSISMDYQDYTPISQPSNWKSPEPFQQQQQLSTDQMTELFQPSNRHSIESKSTTLPVPMLRSMSIDSGESGNSINTSNTTMSKISRKSGVNRFGISPQTRHARRIYVGGINPNNTDEESLKSHLNSILAKALGDDPESTYILSVYYNAQKCFAFIELNSIELTTACLELDGLLYLNSPLKVLRANEYKPELVTSNTNQIKLNLTGLSFSNSTSLNVISNNIQTFPVLSTVSLSVTNVSNIAPQVDQLIRYCSIHAVQRGSIAIIGFPYDEPSRKYSGVTNVSQSPPMSPITVPQLAKVRGCGLSPKSIRSALRKYLSGSIQNAEYDRDLSSTKIVDVGDIQSGLPIDEAYQSLSGVIIDMIQRDILPLIIGGPSDMISYVSSAAMSGYSNKLIGVMNISSTVDSNVISDSRFYNSNAGPALNCDGRFINFASQGSCSSVDDVQTVLDCGGNIVWYNKELRDPLQVVDKFKDSLNSVTGSNSIDSRNACIFMSFGAVNSVDFPGHSQLHSVGITAANTIDIGYTIGKNRNVSDFIICISFV